MGTNFQTIVNRQPAPGEAGDFAGVNPRASVNAPPGGFVADSDSITVGYFAWGDPATGLADNDLVANALLGFVHREQQALITAFLGSTSQLVPQGYPVTLMSQGDFWAYFPLGGTVGAPVYANNTTGAPQTASGGGTLTPWTLTTAVDVVTSVTGSIAPNSFPQINSIMTVSVFGSGAPLSVGQDVTGTGVLANTIILEQLTGTPGGTGTYLVSNTQTVGSETLTAVGGQMGKISTWQTA